MVLAGFERDVGRELHRCSEGNVAALLPPFVLFLVTVRAVSDTQVLTRVVLYLYPGGDGPVLFLQFNITINHKIVLLEMDHPISSDIIRHPPTCMSSTMLLLSLEMVPAWLALMMSVRLV